MTEAEIVELVLKTSKKITDENVKTKNDRRLRNTKLLLKHYNHFKDHIDKAIYNGTSIDFVDNDDNIEEVITINSIKGSISRTYVMLVHVKTMLGIFRDTCNRSNDINKRRFRTLTRFYFEQMKLEDISEIENVDTRTISRDLRAAENEMCALIFGIGGIDRMSE